MELIKIFSIIFLIILIIVILGRITKKTNEYFLILNNVNKNKDFNESICKKNNLTLKNIAEIWKMGGGKKEDCPAALIIASGESKLTKDKKKIDVQKTNIGSLWQLPFYNISPNNYNDCHPDPNPCCVVESVARTLEKPIKKFNLAYTCYNAPKIIPKGFIGEGNPNYIGRFCHVGGESYNGKFQLKENKFTNDTSLQFSGGSCSKGCEINDNSTCLKYNNKCPEKYSFPYYYYNKFLNLNGINNVVLDSMEKESMKIAKNICKKYYK